MSWAGLGWAELVSGWARLGWAKLGEAVLGCIVLCRAGMDGMGWAEASWRCVGPLEAQSVCLAVGAAARGVLLASS